MANGRDDVREALEKHQILSIYNNERIHLHIAPDLTPTEMKKNVKVLIEIDNQRNNQIEIDIRFVIASSNHYLFDFLVKLDFQMTKKEK
jgi:hypothetical protein